MIGNVTVRSVPYHEQLEDILIKALRQTGAHAEACSRSARARYKAPSIDFKNLAEVAGGGCDCWVGEAVMLLGDLANGRPAAPPDATRGLMRYLTRGARTRWTWLSNYAYARALLTPEDGAASVDRAAAGSVEDIDANLRIMLKALAAADAIEPLRTKTRVALETLAELVWEGVYDEAAPGPRRGLCFRVRKAAKTDHLTFVLEADPSFVDENKRRIRIPWHLWLTVPVSSALEWAANTLDRPLF